MRFPTEAVLQMHDRGMSAREIVNAIYKQTRLGISVADVQSVIDGMSRASSLNKDLPPPPPLMEFIPQQQKRYRAPLHLKPFIDLFDQIGKKPMRIVGHVPPRHGKTETMLMAIAHGIRQDPSRLFGYSTYAMDLTLSKSIAARRYAEESGVRLVRDAAKEWRTKEDGGLIATSVGGPLTGYGINAAMFVDDAYKNRVQAESKTVRNMIWDWLSDVVISRLEPGASLFILMTRWHPDDLGGRALRELGKHKRTPEGARLCPADCPGCGPNPIDGFEEILLPALDPYGNALWAERWSAEALLARKREVTTYTWMSLYQGTPRGRGSAVFSGVSFYDPGQLPKAGFKLAIGIDLSYTESTSADWAVAVVLMQFGNAYFVLEVVREQLEAPKFAKILLELRKRWKNPPMYSIFYGPEKGSIDFMRTLGLPIRGLKRAGDKFVRAQATAAVWNDSRIQVPQTSRVEQHELVDGERICSEDCEGCGIGLVDYNHKLIDGQRTCDDDCKGCRFPWLDPFIEVVTGFTGVKDDCDDDVDALVAAFEGIHESPAAMIEKIQALSRSESLRMPGDDIGPRRNDDPFGAPSI